MFYSKQNLKEKTKTYELVSSLLPSKSGFPVNRGFTVIDEKVWQKLDQKGGSDFLLNYLEHEHYMTKSKTLRVIPRMIVRVLVAHLVVFFSKK